MSADEGWVAVMPLAGLARRGKARVVVGEAPIALFLVGERVFAIADVCPHEGRSLSRGTVLGERVVCPGHQWTFDLPTGQGLGRGVCQPVYPARVVDGEVQVQA